MSNTLALPLRANCPTRADLFRQIFRDHFDRWCDLRLDDEVPADQRAYVRPAARLKGVRYRVEPQRPPDVLGLYVYLPVPK